MKKILLLSALLVVCCCGCSKYCTCTNPNVTPDQEIEIAYNEDCGNYSNNGRTCR